MFLRDRRAFLIGALQPRDFRVGVARQNADGGRLRPDAVADARGQNSVERRAKGREIAARQFDSERENLRREERLRVDDVQNLFEPEFFLAVVDNLLGRLGLRFVQREKGRLRDFVRFLGSFLGRRRSLDVLAAFDGDAPRDDGTVAGAERNADARAGLDAVAKSLGNEIIELAVGPVDKGDFRDENLALGVVQFPNGILGIKKSRGLVGHRVPLEFVLRLYSPPLLKHIAGAAKKRSNLWKKSSRAPDVEPRRVIILEKFASLF